MDGVKARELLDDPEYSSQLTMDQFEKLLLRAGYPDGVAHEAAMQRGWDRLSAGVEM